VDADQNAGNAELLDIADRTLPGGGLGSSALAGNTRFVFHHGKGARIWDADGTEYIDYVGGAGALILGHAHPAVVAAAQEQAARGMHMFGVLNDVAVHLARRLVDEIPCAERIAYATTGSEATAYAMRLARAFTGRDKVMKFEGAYHGNHDYALVSTFPSHPANYPDGQADTCGQPEATRSTMMVAPYNDAETVEKLVKEHKGEIAAIIVECVQRIIPAEPGFLRALRRICDDNDIVLVFDEVVTGFRLAPGGGQDYFGVTPDLATYGKVVGGSGPLSCVAGRAEIVDLADPARKGQMDFAYFNGTLHGNPVAAAATLATLDELARPGTHDRLNAYADDFCREAQKVLDANGVRAIACNTGSLWQILFVAARPRNQADMLAGDAAAMRRLDTELLKRGQYNIPGVRRFFSLAHGEREMEETLKALDASCRALA
jgi:glutamate-1-semialdehyde 2,1-aminomutase